VTDQMAGRVSAHPFFAELTAEQIAVLSGDGAPMAYGPGERIFAEGGVADRFWLLDTGSVALDMRVPGRGDQVIETLLGGTVLGWSWLHPPYRWHFGANTLEPVTAVRFDAAAVRLRCETDPEFGYAILNRLTQIITERLQATRLRLLDLWSRP
jgi:CRP/FNR family cyclic AMP-dependent transcriptional regulator